MQMEGKVAIATGGTAGIGEVSVRKLCELGAGGDEASFITGTSLIVDGGLLIPTGGMGFQEFGTGKEGKE